ncbi:MAG TPA: zinc ribbon domain-containing protein [Chthonomonadaceae bacterium]|nr:zinc ribbon domain-containing protein [Chthonomonadaceae bacterium]
MQCPECELENEEGALYCARCHKPLPRKLAPGECPHCGRMPEPGELPPAVCPSCGGDPERGKQIKEQRLAALRAEVALQTQTIEAQRQALAAKKGKKGCGLTLFLCGIALFLGLFVRAVNDPSREPAANRSATGKTNSAHRAVGGVAALQTGRSRPGV